MQPLFFLLKDTEKSVTLCGWSYIQCSTDSWLVRYDHSIVLTPLTALGKIPVVQTIAWALL